MKRSRSTRRGLPAALLSLLLVALAGCSDDPVFPPGPGGLTGVLVSPWGDEAALLVELVGPGIGPVESSANYRFVEHFEDRTRVLLIREGPGTITFTVQLHSRDQPPRVDVLQVAGPDDELRPNPEGYSVRFEIAR